MKIFTRKVKLWLFGILGLITSLGISFIAGTWNPNVINNLQSSAKETMKIEWIELGLKKPSIEYSNNKEFVLAVNRCIQWHNFSLDESQRIPREIIIAMAVLESGYGKSRFALEGNNLFGIRTWDQNTPQLKPKGNPDVVWGVKAYQTKCDSVIDMIYTVNTHHAYEGYRVEREHQGYQLNVNSLIDELHKWSTNEDYVYLVKQKVTDITKILQEQ